MRRLTEAAMDRLISDWRNRPEARLEELVRAVEHAHGIDDEPPATRCNTDEWLKCKNKDCEAGVCQRALGRTHGVPVVNKSLYAHPEDSPTFDAMERTRGVLVGDGTGDALPPLPESAYPPDAKPLLTEQGVKHEDTVLLDFIASEYLDLVAFSMPTGAGDADVGWKLLQHHMGEKEPREVGVAYRDEPRDAIRDALQRLGHVPGVTRLDESKENDRG